MTQEYQKGFWKAYNSSRCKTVMMVISIIITLSFCLDQLFGGQNQDLAKGFFAIMAYWIGRTTKAEDK